MITRSLPLGIALVLAACAVSGCAPEPAPSPTAPVFATEDEAFAAAEETYRSYVDALNAVDLSDPATFEDVYAWTTGDANAGARKSFSEMHAEGWSVDGNSTFDGFVGTQFSPGDDVVVTADVCLDVASVRVTNASGESMVPDTRRDRQPARLTFDAAGTATGLTISSSGATDADSCD